MKSLSARTVARTGSAVTRVLPALPTQLLHRIRTQFLLLALVVVVIALIDLRRIDTIASLPGYLGVVAGYLVWAGLLYRFGERRRWRWLDVGGPVLVAALGILAGDYEWAFPAMYGALFLHGTYGSARRSTTNALLYVIGYEVAVAVTRGPETIAAGVFSHAIGVFVVAYLVRTIAGSVRRHDEIRVREERLIRTSADLLTAEDPGEVAGIALAAVVGVIERGHGDYRVSVWRLHDGRLEMTAIAGLDVATSEVPLEALPSGLLRSYLAGEVLRLGPADMTALQHSMGLPDEFPHGLSMPLVEAGQLTGLLFVATGAPLESDTIVALERFMHEVSLADVLVRRQALLRGVVDNSADAIVQVDRRGLIGFASPAMGRLVGAPAGSLVDRPIGDVLFRRQGDELLAVDDLHEAAASGGPLVVFDGDEARQVELSVSTVDRDAVVVNLRDITERRRLEDEITFRAFHDPVTGLANRALFNDRVEHALARADRDGGRFAVALIDLDDFKSVNDVHGHAVGDLLLAETADRLSAVLRRGDTPARFGGDEFAILMEDVADDSEVEAVLGRVVEALRRPFPIGDRRLMISASVGVRIGDATEAPETIVADADVAMYVAKAKGKNQLVRFEDGMRMAATERLQLKTALQEAIEKQQLGLRYQPIVELDTGAVAGFEALVRWNHRTRGPIAPDVFIPIAEQTGLIVPLGRWVLREACAQLAAWLEAGVVPANTRMNVNLSAHQLLGSRLIQDVVGTLESTGLAPEQLGLEVTETALMAEPERAGEVLAELTAIGVQIAIDDFGTGYSSFAYLQRFPVDAIKVDRSFVARVAEGPEQAALAHAIVKLAQTLRMRTVAEGVEDPMQEAVLAGWGCSHGQGWHWAPAMSAADTVAWLGDRRREEPGVLTLAETGARVG